MQIVDQVNYAAASGRLRPGDSLPSIRQLAERLRVNRNTVDKAYRELDRQGVVRTARGRGAFLAERAPESPDKKALLIDAVDGLIQKARQLHIGRDELFELMDERLAESTKK